MRKFIALLALSVPLVGIAVGVAVADPNLTPATGFTPHKHFLQKDGGTLVEVGPKVCDDGTASTNWGAFLQYHSNHHSHAGLVADGPQGPVSPGINDADGPRLVARGCTFQP